MGWMKSNPASRRVAGVLGAAAPKVLRFLALSKYSCKTINPHDEGDATQQCVGVLVLT
jgi:hypothetical protein